jgi:sugar lactone lactonase YvrE
VTLIERSESKPSVTTGIFATLRASISAKGTGAPSAPRLILTPLITLVALLASLALSAAPASAGIVHKFQSAITETEPLSPFSEPWGLAFDSTGSLYVADATGKAIDIFSPLSVFRPPQLNDASVGANPFTGPYVRSVAVDNLAGPNQGTVYVAESNEEYVDVFKPEAGGKYKLAQERHFGGGYMYVAFDNSGGPNGGDVYVFAHQAVDVIKPNAAGELEEAGVALPAPPGGFSLGGSKFDAGLAVGSTGKVYLANPKEKAVDVYSNEDVLEEAATITGSETPAGAGSFEPIAVGVDPSNGEVYVVDAANKAVDEFSSVGKYLGQIKEAKPEAALVNPLGVAVNASGDVYVSDGGAAAVDVFGPDIMVPAVHTGLPTEVTGSSVTLNGTVNPEGVEVTDCHFDYGTTASYGQTAACEQTVGKGSGEVAVTAKLTGLAAGTTYHFLLQASNANGTNFGSDATLATLPPPSIAGASVANLSATSAELQATVNPLGFLVTSCAFEYGTSTSYGLLAPCAQSEAQIGVGSEPVPVSAVISPLEANKTYHWRLVATNAAGTATSVDHTFVYATEGAGLPDGRQYELVTPPEKNGASVGTMFSGAGGGVEQVAADGTRVMSLALQCLVGAQSCIPVKEGGQGIPVEFERGSSGWVAHSLGPPTDSFAGGKRLAANPDSGAELWLIPPAGSSGANGERDFYGQQGGVFTDIGPVAEHPNLETSAELVTPHAATADLSHFVYPARQPLWAFDPTVLQPGSEEHIALYEYEKGESRPRLVALAPGSSELVSRCGATLGGVSPRYDDNALSEDGETVYFTAEPCTKYQEEQFGGTSKVQASTLYARYEHARSELISGPAPSGPVPVDGEACNVACQSNPPAFANFAGASGDGSRVFFTDSHQLTDGASEDGNQLVSRLRYCAETPAGASGCNLYESECPNRCKMASERRLVDVSVGDKSGGGPRVQGVVAISRDGSHVYFVAQGELTGANGEGHSPVAGQPNLYVYERDGSFPAGRLAYVTTFLSREDEENWHTSETGGEVGRANVTRDGRFLVFMSYSALTPDDTRVEGKPPAQVYRYDAATERLMRVSIGAKGFRDNGNEGAGDAKIIFAEEGLERQIDPLRGDPTMSDNGRFVFFQSPVGLTPHALNDVVVSGASEEPKYAQNVYEWEAPGTEVDGRPTCTEPAGCVFLISDGKDVAETNQRAATGGENSVELIGSDESGANVFFSTSDSLVAQDTDTERDIYDAHICSSGLPCPSPAAESPPCLGEVCHGIPAEQQGAPTGGTLTLNGLGNIGPVAPAVKRKALTRAQKLAAALKLCKRDRKKAKRQACERQAGKKYGALKAKKAKRSSYDRRTSR